MKRILIVATTSKAGMGPYVSEIVNTFSGEDSNVYFLFKEDNIDYFQKNIKKELIKHSYFYFEKNKKREKFRKLSGIGIGKFGKFVLNKCRELEINVVHFINGCDNSSLIKKLKSNSIETAITVHDLIPHEIAGSIKTRLIQKIIAKRLTSSILICDKLITNSGIQYEELRANFPEKKILYHEFPSLVTKQIAEGNDCVEEISGLRDYILFFGRIEAYKGVEFLCESFCTSPDLYTNNHLVIAGKGNLKIKEEWKNKNIVILNRYIKDSEIATLYRNARVVVYPYISATQSGVLSIAFYYQTPVLTSDIPYFKSIIEKSKTGLMFKNKDVNDLTIKLMSLLNVSQDIMKEKQKEFYFQNYLGINLRLKLLNFFNL